MVKSQRRVYPFLIELRTVQGNHKYRTMLLVQSPGTGSFANLSRTLKDLSRFLGQPLEVFVGVDGNLVSFHEVFDKRLECLPIEHDQVSEGVDGDRQVDNSLPHEFSY